MSGAREAVLATLHGKLPLIAPALEPLGIALRAIEVDTDALGTFTGEVPRPAGPREVAVAKARLGMRAAGVPVGLASEGSIGPLPANPFLIADLELVALVDEARGLTVVGRHLSHDLRVVGRSVVAGEPLDDLAVAAGLPEHRLIVRPAAGPRTPVVKGIADVDELAAAVARCAAASDDARARVETDLRAHLCPSRRPAIAAAAADLAARLAATCPACGSPGWGVERSIPGRPCAACAMPTDVPRADLEACVVCPEARERPRTDAGAVDPARCARCNP